MKPGTMIIIQARTGSTRLPGKTVMPFFNGKSIFTILAENLTAFFGKENIVLATTDRSSDDGLVRLALKQGIHLFRGNEQDVLGRFIEAARQFNAQRIVRICADNPFLFPHYVGELLDAYESAPCDYLSFRAADGTPVIRTHWGLFAEVASLDALERAAAETDEPFFHEHVTNYLYGNPEKFRLRFLELPSVFEGRKDYRFTLDTPADLELLRILYLNLFNTYHTISFTAAQLFEYLDHEGADIVAAMRKQIDLNAK